jgi:hypothetical protein
MLCVVSMVIAIVVGIDLGMHNTTHLHCFLFKLGWVVRYFKFSWLVSIVNFVPDKWCFQIFKAWIISNISFSWVG